MTTEHVTSPHLPSPRPIDRGVAGASIHPGLDRRATAARRRWTRAAWRERRLGNLLERRLGVFAVVMHDRRVATTGKVIDHLVVAPSGVWVVSATHDIRRVRPGHIDPADIGSADLGSAADATRTCLAAIGFDWVDVQTVTCFTNGDWRLRAKPFRSNGSWVSRPTALIAQIEAPGALAPRDLQTVAAALSSALPCAAG